MYEMFTGNSFDEFSVGPVTDLFVNLSRKRRVCRRLGDVGIGNETTDGALISERGTIVDNSASIFH
jgi:hypothetical protein